MAFYKVNNINVYVEQWNEQKSETIVLLHGFTGSCNTWHETIAALNIPCRIIAIDLIGHGRTDCPEDEACYKMDSQITILHDLFMQLQLQKFHLVGYSMGGRVALSFACQHPDCLASLILESATPGIESEEERKLRQQNDNALAEKIEANGVEAFVNNWENIPLFASQKLLPMQKQAAIRQERLSQKALGLASSLRMMGTGIMPSLWEKFSSLPIPVTLITGELDQKFVNIANKMQKIMPEIAHITVSEAGHAIHVENPQKFATIVKESIFNN